MSAHAQPISALDIVGTGKQRFYKTMVLMVSTAVILSAAVIIYFQQVAELGTFDVGGQVQLLTATLLPYLISAAIAAVTAIGILTMLPAVRACAPAQLITYRLKELREGNLQSTVKIGTNHQLQDLASELNMAISSLGGQLTKLKVVNRQQWRVLCQIRTAAMAGNNDEVVKRVEEMERNWVKIAEIEEKLMT